MTDETDDRALPGCETGRAYESLRNLLSVNGFDPEIAREDEGYGIGISFPEGVYGPNPEVAKRLINMAMGLGPNGELPPPTCRHCGRGIHARMGRRKMYWLHNDSEATECHPQTHAEPLRVEQTGGPPDEDEWDYPDGMSRSDLTCGGTADG